MALAATQQAQEELARAKEAWVEAELDAYHRRGVRALFPVHKYDNQFSPGDGSDAFIALGTPVPRTLYERASSSSSSSLLSANAGFVSTKA